MQAQSVKQLNRKNQIWLLAALLTILVIASAALAGTCLYTYAHQSDSEISLKQGDANSQAKSASATYKGTQAKKQAKKYDMKVTDAKKVWTTETAVELFKVRYRNGKGEVTVQSAGKDKVVAPGTDGKYSFALKNTGSKALDYKVWVETKLNIDNSKIKELPLQARMSSEKGWLLGDKKNWENAKKLDGVETKQTVDAGKQVEYNLYWQWPFEQGTDATDTSLGNLAANNTLTYTVKIHTLAMESLSDSNPGHGGKSGQTSGTRGFLARVKTADTARLAMWAGICAVAAGVVLVLIIWKRKKETQES